VAEQRGLFDQAITRDPFLVLDRGGQNLADTVQVAQAVRTAGECEPDQLVGRRGDRDAVLVLAAEVEGTQLHRADAAFEVELTGERVAGEAVRGNVRKQAARVEVEGVQTRWFDDGDARLAGEPGEVPGGVGAGLEVAGW
jgi:hypothetical protein